MPKTIHSGCQWKLFQSFAKGGRVVHERPPSPTLDQVDLSPSCGALAVTQMIVRTRRMKDKASPCNDSLADATSCGLILLFYNREGCPPAAATVATALTPAQADLLLSLQGRLQELNVRHRPHHHFSF